MNLRQLQPIINDDTCYFRLSKCYTVRMEMYTKMKQFRNKIRRLFLTELRRVSFLILLQNIELQLKQITKHIFFLF